MLLSSLISQLMREENQRRWTLAIDRSEMNLRLIVVQPQCLSAFRVEEYYGRVL